MATLGIPAPTPPTRSLTINLTDALAAWRARPRPGKHARRRADVLAAPVSDTSTEAPDEHDSLWEPLPNDVAEWMGMAPYARGA